MLTRTVPKNAFSFGKSGYVKQCASFFTDYNTHLKQDTIAMISSVNDDEGVITGTPKLDQIMFAQEL